jgi:RNA 2',3'-cyclic 3'-phosphodiesterase
METKRLFLAIPLPEETKEAYANYMAPFSHLLARFVPKENLHITGLFIGDTFEDRISPLKEAISKALLHVSPFSLELEKVCYFPERFPHMIWGRYGKSKKFDALLLELKEISPAGEEKENIPHVTLARLKQGFRPDKVHLPPLLLPPLLVKECALMESLLSSKSPVYTTLETFPLCTVTPS